METKNTEDNTKRNLCIFLFVLFFLLSIICLSIWVKTKESYISEQVRVEADEAKKTIKALQSNIWDLNPDVDVDTSKLDKIVLKRNICIIGMIIGVIGIIICCIILCSKPNKTKQLPTKSQSNNSSIQSSLQELEQLYKNSLITQEEYMNKREEIIERL